MFKSPCMKSVLTFFPGGARRACPESIRDRALNNSGLWAVDEAPTPLLIPGGTGYQPVAVGNLPTGRSFIAIAPMLALRPCVQEADLSSFHLCHSLTELNHQSSKLLCSLATSIARICAKLRDIAYQIKTRQNTNRTFLNLFYTYFHHSLRELTRINAN